MNNTIPIKLMLFMQDKEFLVIRVPPGAPASGLLENEILVQYRFMREDRYLENANPILIC